MKSRGRLRVEEVVAVGSAFEGPGSRSLTRENQSGGEVAGEVELSACRASSPTRAAVGVDAEVGEAGGG